MPSPEIQVVEKINTLLRRFMDPAAMASERELEDHPDATLDARIVSCRTAISLFAPPHSIYREEADRIMAATTSYQRAQRLARLAALLQALRDDYADGLLIEIRHLLQADLFDDFLDMAAHLLETGYKDPAAVIAGSVLERHLRELCEANGIDVIKPDGAPVKADKLNADLAGAEVYDKSEQKQVTAWLGRRNEAAHGQYEKYDAAQVALMVEGIRGFVSRHPA